MITDEEDKFMDAVIDAAMSYRGDTTDAQQFLLHVSRVGRVNSFDMEARHEVQDIDDCEPDEPSDQYDYIHVRHIRIDFTCHVGWYTNTPLDEQDPMISAGGLY